MKLGKSYRYSTNLLIEGQFEPGSNNRVYKNLLGITKKREIDEIEWQNLVHTFKELVNKFDIRHQFVASDIKNMHYLWLGNIYPWAGKYRQVNLSKGGFPFAAANQIPRLMDILERSELRKYTPCCFNSLQETIMAISVVHAELVLIHPFREGNGRISRLLSNLMALQAGLPALDFGGIRGQKRQEYFAAVRAGLDRNYQPMVKIFTSIVRRTLRKFRES